MSELNQIGQCNEKLETQSLQKENGQPDFDKYESMNDDINKFLEPMQAPCTFNEFAETIATGNDTAVRNFNILKEYYQNLGTLDYLQLAKDGLIKREEEFSIGKSKVKIYTPITTGKNTSDPNNIVFTMGQHKENELHGIGRQMRAQIHSDSILFVLIY